MESGVLSEGGVGSIVWVRRRSGTWWPGKIMGTEELLASELESPRTGIPVTLIGSTEAYVYWCNLENPKRVKAFRCGEFDDCIERAESTQDMLPDIKKTRNRREDAIRHALEVEKDLLRKQGKLNRPADARSNGGEQMGCDSRAKKSRCKYLPPESFDVLDYNKIPPNKIEISSSHFSEGDTYPSPDYMIGGKISEFMEVVGTGFSESTSSESESESDSSVTEPDMHEDITSHSALGSKMGRARCEGTTRASMTNKESRRVSQRISCEGTTRAFKRVSRLRSDHPFFTIVITARFLQLGHPSIPKKFSDEHIDQLPKDVTLVFKGESWPMRMIPSSGRSGRFSVGWHAFTRGNKLKVGDVCRFEMIEKKNLVLKVSISRDGLTLG